MAANNRLKRTTCISQVLLQNKPLQNLVACSSQAFIMLTGLGVVPAKVVPAEGLWISGGWVEFCLAPADLKVNFKSFCLSFFRDLQANKPISSRDNDKQNRTSSTARIHFKPQLLIFHWPRPKVRVGEKYYAFCGKNCKDT